MADARVAGEVRVGISGWRYPPWRGVFYPEGLAQRRELEYASRRMTSVEINGSFYALQRPESYQRWAAETPAEASELYSFRRRAPSPGGQPPSVPRPERRFPFRRPGSGT